MFYPNSSRPSGHWSLDGDRSAVLDQAENRMHTEQALLLTLLGAETLAPV